MRDGESNAGMEGDYARWFREYPFPRYIDSAKLIPSIEEDLSRGEDGNDEGAQGRGMGGTKPKVELEVELEVELGCGGDTEVEVGQ